MKTSNTFPWSLIHVNLIIVEEQIDETDIRKIPQIVCAESGSLTVPV
jgi:hypothetical protein